MEEDHAGLRVGVLKSTSLAGRGCGDAAPPAGQQAGPAEAQKHGEQCLGSRDPNLLSTVSNVCLQVTSVPN